MQTPLDSEGKQLLSGYMHSFVVGRHLPINLFNDNNNNNIYLIKHPYEQDLFNGRIQ